MKISISNNDGTRASFAKFSRSFAKFSQVFSSFRRFGDVLGPVWTYSDALGHVRIRSESLGSVRTFSEFFGFFLTFFALVPNTGEANDEMCAPTAPKISEMCSLKPFSCCLLLLLL